MHSIRSVLWIGPASGLAESGLLDAPTLDVTWVAEIADALALPSASFDAEILDGLAASELPEAIGRLRAGPRRASVIARIAEDESPFHAKILEAGAREVMIRLDTVPPEVAREELLSTIDRMSDAEPWPGRRDAGDAPDSAHSLPGVVGRSRAMNDVLALVERARDSVATVLISGETGTGKELIARGLHDSGPRASRPFVAVNCAAFPDSLLETELFGHVRGAFTGAGADKPGLFVEANGGTLFLDEIGETSAPLQATLLRALQEREVRPVGSTRTRPVDVRVIAATNRSLREEAGRGFFREDLYYRLAVFPITVPPLRERREDVLPLALHFLARHGKREHKQGCQLSRSAAHLLLAYDWPGNVRELENEMHRALALAEPGGLITPKLLSERITDILHPIAANTKAAGSLRSNMNRIESWLIRRALESQGGRRTATARKLGITREGLYKKMKRLGIE